MRLGASKAFWTKKDFYWIRHQFQDPCSNSHKNYPVNKVGQGEIPNRLKKYGSLIPTGLKLRFQDQICVRTRCQAQQSKEEVIRRASNLLSTMSAVWDIPKWKWKGTYWSEKRSDPSQRIPLFEVDLLHCVLLHTYILSSPGQSLYSISYTKKVN